MGDVKREAEEQQNGFLFRGHVCIQHGGEFCAPGDAYDYRRPESARLYVWAGAGGADGI